MTAFQMKIRLLCTNGPENYKIIDIRPRKLNAEYVNLSMPS